MSAEIRLLPVDEELHVAAGTPWHALETTLLSALRDGKSVRLTMAGKWATFWGTKAGASVSRRMREDGMRIMVEMDWVVRPGKKDKTPITFLSFTFYHIEE